MSKYYIGIDLGGTFIKGGIVNENGEIIVCDKTPTEVEKGDKGVAANIAKLAKSLLEKANIDLSAVEGKDQRAQTFGITVAADEPL